MGNWVCYLKLKEVSGPYSQTPPPRLSLFQGTGNRLHLLTLNSDARPDMDTAVAGHRVSKEGGPPPEKKSGLPCLQCVTTGMSHTRAQPGQDAYDKQTSTQEKPAQVTRSHREAGFTVWHIVRLVTGSLLQLSSYISQWFVC